MESDYEFDAARSHYKNVRRVKWTHKGEWPNPCPTAIKTLTNITSRTDSVAALNALFDSDDDEKEFDYPEYTAENFLEEVFMDKKSYRNLVELVRHKKNIISS